MRRMLPVGNPRPVADPPLTVSDVSAQTSHALPSPSGSGASSSTRLPWPSNVWKRW